MDKREAKFFMADFKLTNTQEMVETVSHHSATPQ